MELVGDALLAQGGLQLAGLVVAAVEDGVVAVAGGVLETVVQQRRDHPLRLVSGVTGLQHLDGLAAAAVRPQPLLEQVGVVADEVVGGVEDAPAGAVVLLQLDHLQARVVAAQVLQQLRPGPAPGVDGLVVVAHHGQAAAVADQGPHQRVLGAVDVLELVHQQVAHPVAPVLGHLGVLLQQPHRQVDQVVEVGGVVGVQGLLVAGVDPRRAGGLLVRGGLQGGGRGDAVALPARDPRPHLLRGGHPEAPGLLHQPPHQPGLVLAVEQGEGLAVAQAVDVPAQDAQAQAVEGGHDQPPPRAAQALAGALTHLAGGLVGEGDRRDAVRRQARDLDEVGDLGGDHPRLARAGAGEHQQGPLGGGDGLALLGIEVLHRGSAVGRATNEHGFYPSAGANRRLGGQKRIGNGAQAPEKTGEIALRPGLVQTRARRLPASGKRGAA